MNGVRDAVLQAFTGMFGGDIHAAGPMPTYGDLIPKTCYSSEANAPLVFDHKPTQAELDEARQTEKYGKFRLVGTMVKTDSAWSCKFKIVLPEAFVTKARGEPMPVQDPYEIGVMFVNIDKPPVGRNAVTNGQCGKGRIKIAGMKKMIFVNIWAHSDTDVYADEGPITTVKWTYQPYTKDFNDQANAEFERRLELKRKTS